MLQAFSGRSIDVFASQGDRYEIAPETAVAAGFGRRKRTKLARLAGCTALLSLFALQTASATENSGNPLVDHVRAANSRFEDASVALAEGYASIPCTSGIDVRPPGTAAR